jgi:hypothetical protein
MKKSPLLKQRKRAMDKEMAMLNTRSVFHIIKQKTGMVVVSTRRFSVVKFSLNGNRYEAHFVVGNVTKCLERL